jgi:hypothetical protein
MVPGFDTGLAKRRLAALVAAIQAFPVDRQDAVLRQYLECGLDRLESLEDAYYEFLGECVHLAIGNMQDVRLQSIETRLAALENPDGPSAADILWETAFVFGMSIAALAAVEAVGGLVLLYIGKEAAAPAVRAAVVNAEKSFLSSGSAQSQSLQNLQNRLTLLRGQRRGLPPVLEAIQKGSFGSFVVEAGKALLSPIATARSFVQALTKTHEISDEVATVLNEILLSQMALHEGNVRLVKIRGEYEKALAGDATIPNAKWRKFMDDATGGIALAPAYSIFSGIWKNIPEAQASGDAINSVTVGGVFLTSGPAGKILTWARDHRLAIASEYSMLRAALRYRPDETLASDDLVIGLAELVNELIPFWESYRAIQDSIRPFIVRGYEAALWWAYLNTNGMLGVKEGARYTTQTSFVAFAVGDIQDGYVITSVPPKTVLLPPTRTGTIRIERTYEARFYPGIQMLTEGTTEHLYEHFCKPYFAIKENAAKLPFKYVENNYKGVSALPKEFWGGFVSNLDRTIYMNQMRLMVILFFLQLPETKDPTSTGLLNQLGEINGTPPSAAAWVSLNPAGQAISQDGGLSLVPSAKSVANAGEGLTAMLADTDTLGPLYYQGLRSELRNAVDELRLDIDDYQKLLQGETTPGETSRGKDVEEYWQLIKASQLKLLSLYDKAFNAAQFDKAEQQKIESEYRSWVEYLSLWIPEQSTTTVPTGSSPFHFESEDAGSGP